MASSYHKRTERPHRRGTSASQTSYNNYINSFYSPASEAYALPVPEAYPEYPAAYPSRQRPQPRKRVQKTGKRKKPVKRTAHLEYVHSTEKEKRMSFMSFVLIFFLFSGALVSLLTFAAISMKNIELNTLEANLKETKEIRESLVADLSQGVDLVQVEAIATAKLGMSKPNDYQIIEVTVPKQSYFVQYHGEEGLEPIRAGLDGILDLFNIDG